MGWFWRVCGSTAGACVGLVYAALAGRLLWGGAVVFVADSHGVSARDAADSLWGFMRGAGGALLAGYVLAVALSYLLMSLLAAFNSNNPGPWGAVAYLLVVALVAALAGRDVFTAARTHPLEAVVCVAAAAAFALGHALFVGAGYVLAATFAGPPGSDSGGESWWRGYLIGLNAVLNVVFATAAYAFLLEPLLQNRAAGAARVIALALGVVNLTAALASTRLILFMPAALAGPLQALVEGFLGWLNWLMPMSWVVTGVGLIFFCLTWVGHFLAAFAPGTAAGLVAWLTPADYPVGRAMVDWSAGVMLLDSGVVGNSSLGTSGLLDIKRRPL